MMKIVEYKILSSNFIPGFSEMVNGYIKEGWQPFGSPTISEDSIDQAMVKYEEPKSNGEVIEDLIVRLKNVKSIY